jgi:hypothetical protein
MDNVHFLQIGRVPTLPKKMSKFSISSLDSKFKYNYFKDSENLSKKKVDSKLIDLFILDKTWLEYKTDFKVINNFYFKFEINMGKVFSNNIYFLMDSDRSKDYLISHIIRFRETFLLKIFLVSKSSSRVVSIWRTTLSYDNISENVAFIYEKNLNSLRLKIKSRKHNIQKLFTIANYFYISFSFIMNDACKLSLSSVYFTDTYNLDEDNSKYEKTIFNKYSIDNYNSFKCPSKEKQFCVILFCKICCKRTISLNPSFEKCQLACYKNIDNSIMA